MFAEILNDSLLFMPHPSSLILPLLPSKKREISLQQGARRKATTELDRRGGRAGRSRTDTRLERAFGMNGLASGGWLWAYQAAGEKAAEGVPAGDPNAAPSMMSLLLPMAVMMAAFYFLILLPESRKNKQRQLLLAGMKKGDEVLTNGGIIGVVQNVKDDRVVLKVDEARGVTIEFAKSSIGQILKSKGGEAEAVSAAK